MKFQLGVGLLWAVCAGFSLGVFVRSLLVVPEESVLCLGLLALAGIAFTFTDTKRFRIALVCAAAIVAFGAGVLRMEGAILPGDPFFDTHLGQKVSIEGTVSGEPDKRATQVRVPISLANSRATVLAIFPAYTEIYYGEHVRANGTVNLPKSFDAGAGRQFNYPGYLAAQGIGYELDRATLVEGSSTLLTVNSGFEGNPLTAFSYRIKELFVSGLERALPEPQSGLAGGITVGDKRAMGKDLSEEFRTVSLVHIIVLSGYNIMIVISALFQFLSWAPRYLRFGAGGFVALFFVVMTGFASASLRAALMALISITGTLTGRIYRADRALALVSTVMLAWNPYLLVFDPGFQLSFLACAGLLIFSPIFSEWFARVPKTFTLQETLVSTSGAQLAVLPLLLYESGNLSLVSIPANLLVLAAVPSAMLFSAIAAVAGLVIEPLAPLIGLPALALLSYILGVAHVLSSIPFAAVLVPAFNAWLLVPIYVALFGYGLYWNSTHNEKTAPEKV